MPRAGVSVAAREPRQYDNAIDEVSLEKSAQREAREPARARSRETSDSQASALSEARPWGVADSWGVAESRSVAESRGVADAGRWGTGVDEASSRAPGAAIPGRRTITIQGRGAERYTPRRRRPPRTLEERSRLRPDRTAMWAVLLGVLLVLAAATSSRAAAPSSAPAAPSALVAHVH